MRQITKRLEPRALTEWRGANQGGPNLNYHAIGGDLRRAIREVLVEEQGGICAYTGQRISVATCHIEHPKPQSHCRPGEDVDYNNMLACIPKPNAPQMPYGAHQKGNWPDDASWALFVSPNSQGCERRFKFSLRGEIAPANGDAASEETIRHLGLGNKLLCQLRKSAIDQTLQVRGRGPASLDLPKARRRLTGLQHAEQTEQELEPFCFALRQALTRHIRRVEGIRRNNRRRG